MVKTLTSQYILIALVIQTLIISGYSAAAPFNQNSINSQSSQPTFVRLDYASENDVPSELRKAINQAFTVDAASQASIDDQDAQTPPLRSVPVSIYFALTNDLNILRIFGVQRNTDDFGYTHGSEFRIVGQLPNDYTLSLNYTTDLYTKPVEGELTQKSEDRPLKQYFTDENILKLVIQHKPENQLFFWKAEAGWIELNQEYRKRYLNASTQQSVFHDFVNSISAQTTKDPEYMNREEGRRNGLLAGVYMGLAKTFSKDTDSCKKTIEIQAGLRATTIPDTTLRTLESQLAFDCGFQFTKNRFRVEAGYQVTQHDGGEQRQQYFDFSTKRTKWKFGLRLEETSGDLVNYVDYNQTNVYDGTIDPVFRIYMQRDLK